MNLTAKDIAKALGVKKRQAQTRAAKEGWAFETRKFKGGLQRLYPLSSLPEGIKEKVIFFLKSHPEAKAPAEAPIASSASSSTAGDACRPPAVEPPGAGGAATPSAPPPAPHPGPLLQGERGFMDFALAPAAAQEKARAWERVLRAAGDASGQPGRTVAIDHFVAAYNAGHKDPDTLGGTGKISRSTLYRKFAALEQGGLPALLPAHKGRQRDLHPDVEQKAIAYFLDRSRKARRIWEYLKQDFPEKITPSYSALVRFLNAWANDHPQEVVLAHWGESKWKKRFLAAFCSASEDAPYPNHTWEIDTTVADIMTNDGKRWKIVACIDVFSRLLTAIMLQPKTNAWGIVQTLAKGFDNYGIPERLKKDNGKDYASRWVNRFLSDLGIKAPKLPVRAPERKPHIERFYRTLSECLFSELTGHTGNSLLTRPEEIRVNYSAGELMRIIDRWAESTYNEQAPSTTGEIRRERFFQPGLRLRKAAKEELDILMNPVFTNKRVQKKGIVFDGRTYYAPELVGLVGQRVEFRLDVNDVSRIMVFRKKEFYCRAFDAAAAQWPMEKYRDEKRAYSKALKHDVRAQKELAKGTVRDRMLKSLDEKEAAAPLRFPAAVEVEKIIDISKCSVKEPEKAEPKTPYDEYPERITLPMPIRPAWENYEYIMKAEALGIPLAPEVVQWRDDYVSGRLQFHEREWWNLYGRFKNDPSTAIPLWWEIEQLKKYAANTGR